MENLLSKPKSRKVAAFLALLGTVTPLAGLHKFYLGQPLWGIAYFLLLSTPIPHIACAIEIVWYFVQDQEDFERRFNSTEQIKYTQSSKVESNQVSAIADSLRQLDKLRQEGLMSEYEFEQKRRQLLKRIA